MIEIAGDNRRIIEIFGEKQRKLKNYEESTEL